MFTFTPLRRLGRGMAAAALLLCACLTAGAARPSEAGFIAPASPAPASAPTPAVDAVPAPAAIAPPENLTPVRTGLAMPLVSARITSGFAIRRHPIKKKRHHHRGVDFAAPRGTPVRSADHGVVEFAGIKKGYGKVVYIAHDAHDRTTVYAHLDRIDVRNGQRVGLGDTIGTVGKTGLATGPHLHFEVREGGRPIDPMGLAYDVLTDFTTTASAEFPTQQR